MRPAEDTEGRRGHDVVGQGVAVRVGARQHATHGHVDDGGQRQVGGDGRIVDGTHPEGHGRRRRDEFAVGGLVREAVIAVESRVGRVDEGAVGLEGQGAIGRQGHRRGGQGIAVRVAVVDQDTVAGEDGQREVLEQRVAVVHGHRRPVEDGLDGVVGGDVVEGVGGDGTLRNAVHQHIPDGVAGVGGDGERLVGVDQHHHLTQRVDDAAGTGGGGDGEDLYETGVKGYVFLAGSQSEGSGVTGGLVGVAVNGVVAALVGQGEHIAIRRVEDQVVVAGEQAVEVVFALVVRLHRGQKLVGRGVQADPNALDARLAGVLDAVLVQVVPDPVAHGGGAQVQHQAVVVGAEQRRVGIVHVVPRHIRVAAARLHLHHERGSRGGSQNVVQRLGVVTEDVGILLAGRHVEDLVRQVGIHFVGARQLGPQRIRAAGDLPQGIHVTAGELKGVEVAQDHERDVRICLLVALHEQGDLIGLGPALEPHALAGVVDGAVVHHQDADGDVHGAGRVVGLEQQRRPVVEDVIRSGAHRIFKLFVRLHLVPVHDGHGVAHQEAHVDAADVPALLQHGGVVQGRVVGDDLGRQVLQDGDVFHFLDAQDVGRTQHGAHLERRLVQTVGVLLGGEHIVVLVRIIHRVVDPVEVLGGHGEFTWRPGPHAPRQGRVRQGQLGGPDLVVAEGIGQGPDGVEGGAAEDLQLGQEQPVGIQVEYLRVGVEYGQSPA